MYDLNGYIAEDYGLDEETFEDIINEYGSVEEYYKQTNIDLSNHIKDEVYKSKKETSKFQNKVKVAFFTALATGVTYLVFKDEIDGLYNEYKEKITNIHKKGYKDVQDELKELEVDKYTEEQETPLKSSLNELLDFFSLDGKTKTEDDLFIRVIANYYKSSLNTLNSGKVDKDIYLTKKVKDYDKIEKVVAYYDKNGNIRAYFDIASYDSMVYNTNLQRLGVQETIKDAIRRNYDIVYIEPHPYSCDKCMDYQGTFISLTGENVGQIFNGYMITESLESAIEGGLLHPNCTHIPRKAYYTDLPSKEYTGAEWNEKYDARQKKQSLELKKQRLLSDKKIYKELGNYAEVDKINQKIKVINQNINDLEKQM